MESKYVGKIKNAASQKVEAPNLKKDVKQAIIHTGTDLRAKKGKK